MISTSSEITQLLLAIQATNSNGVQPVVSIGVVLDGERAFWGDCLLSSGTTEPISTIRRLSDISIPALRGQHVSGFRELCRCLQPHFPPSGMVPVADAVRGAMQQALLDAVAWMRRRTPADVLADEYNFPPPNQLLNEVPLFLEISDFAATAARIDRILELRPTGVGYRLTGGRVAEAIGENAEYLQRFVRELGQRVDFIEGDRDYRPIIYLGLNGALGHLAHDPVRHVGKILGNCVGLQDAAGSHRLIIEEPFILDDPIGQSANLLRLKDFLRLTPSSQKRPEPTHLVARVSSLTDEKLRIYADTQAVHGLNFDLLAIGDIDNMMTRLAALRDTGLFPYLSLSSSNDSLLSPRWAATSVDLALASHSAGLILSFDSGNESLYQTIIRHLSETKAWSDHLLSP